MFEADLKINEIKLELDWKRKVSQMNKVIALGADNGYMDKVETTIKSVCVHNDNINFTFLMMTFLRNGFV